VKAFQALITKENLEMDDLLKKKQYVQVCSLNLDESNHGYDSLAKMLNLNKDDVEVWAIEAIAAGIIDAKID
jgi:hypothetical protein